MNSKTSGHTRVPLTSDVTNADATYDDATTDAPSKPGRRPWPDAKQRHTHECHDSDEPTSSINGLSHMATVATIDAVLNVHVTGVSCIIDASCINAVWKPIPFGSRHIQEEEKEKDVNFVMMTCQKLTMYLTLFHAEVLGCLDWIVSKSWHEAWNTLLSLTWNEFSSCFLHLVKVLWSFVPRKCSQLSFDIVCMLSQVFQEWYDVYQLSIRSITFPLR